MGSITRNFANNILTDGKFDATDVVGNITSTGIDDNATSNAITIDSNERVQFTRPRSNTLGDSALEILPSDTVVGMGFRMENTNNDLVIEKSSPSGFEAEILRIRQGGGIALGGTGDANTLDDYEEGSWTPSDISGAGLTYSNTSGNCFYTKIGRIVIAHFRVTFPSTADGTSARIGGLPFTMSSESAVNTDSVSFGEQNFASGAMGVMSRGTTGFFVITTNGSSISVRTNADCSGKDFRGTAVYRT